MTSLSAAKTASAEEVILLDPGYKARKESRAGSKRRTSTKKSTMGRLISPFFGDYGGIRFVIGIRRDLW